jgi:hypothetical protein
MKKHSQQKVEAELMELGYELLSEYVNVGTNLKLRGMECGHPFERNLSNIKKYPKCPTCKHIRFEKEARDKLQRLGFELISEYMNIRKTSTLKCLKCGRTFKRTLKSLWKRPTCKCWREID